MYKMSTKILLLALIIFILTIINGFLLTYYFINSSHDTEIITQLGLIRGLIQRSTLLALLKKYNKLNESIKQVDNILKQFTVKKKKYYFIISTKKLEKNIYNLKIRWNNLKDVYNNLKLTDNNDFRNKIIKKNEELWMLSDQTVLIAEHRAENLKNRLWVTFYVIIADIFLIIIIIWIIKAVIKDKLEYLANYDSLTNTLKRKIFYLYLNNFIKIAKRYNKIFCLIMFDLDNFKVVNDSYGHQAGDDLLKAAINIIMNHIRETDLLSRFGGDEFLILSPEIDLKNGLIMAEKIRESIENELFSNNIKTTISIGITEYKDNDDVDIMIKRVDDALYKSKNTGRNKCSAL